MASTLVAVPSLDATAAEESMQAEAPKRYRMAYTQWRERLERHALFVGRHLLADASAAGAQSPASRAELQRSIARMQKRWSRWLRTTEEGRGFLFERNVRRRVPGWARAQLRSIAACESNNDPRSVGGGGAYRGLYQFSFSTWRAVGGRGDPAAASRAEQTWRAWLLLSRHGSGQWPVCG